MTTATILSVEVFCNRNNSSPRRTYKHHLEKGTRINGFCFCYEHFFLENEKLDEISKLQKDNLLLLNSTNESMTKLIEDS